MSSPLKLLYNKNVIELCKEVTFDNAIVSITDTKGIILYANENFCQISGYTNEELIGKNHRIIKSGIHDQAFFKEMWGSISKGKVWKGQVCNRSKEGNLYWVETTIFPVEDEQSKDLHFFSVRLDITHQKKFEEVLNNLSQVAKIGYWDWDIKSGKITWTDEIYKIHGVSKEEHTPDLESGINFYAPEHRGIISSLVQRGLETGEPWDVELQILKGKEEIPTWVRSVGYCEMYEGKPYRVHGTFQDIDKEKKVRIEHQRTQNKLALSLESAGIGNWIFYPKINKLVWDDASFSIFGVDKKDFKGTYEDWEKTLLPGEKEKSSNTFLKVLEEKAPLYNNKFKIRHPEKGIRTIKGRAFVEYDTNGEPVEIVGLNWDITSETQFQKALIEARQKALDATQAKSAFLASMSHEIRTPMNGIMGMLELLSDTRLNNQQKDLVETIESCGDQLLGIVNDILDFSKIEAGKLELEYRSFEPEKVIKGVLSIFKAQADKKGVKLLSEVHENMPDFIAGDETRFKQVLTNLVSNALKFTEQGSITVTAKLDVKRSSKNQGIFLFSVADTGLGIPLDKQPRLFESFRQVDETTTRRFGGSGLGLAICRSLVEKMGGHIGVESSEGDGSIFFFEIMAGITTSVEGDSTTTYHSDFRKDLNILIVEDNEVNQRLAVSFLKKLGLKQLKIANNGQEAVTMCLENPQPFDVIFMDVQMPVMDGLTATGEIRKVVSYTPHIIAMTANAFEEDRKKCFAAGMDAFISKPIKKKNIENVLIEAFPSEQSIDPTPQKDKSMEEPKREFALIDKKKILFEFEEDLDIFAELVEDYRSQYPSFVENLEKAASEGDGKLLKITGHTLKGIVSNFYSEELKEAAYKLEEAGAESNFDDIEMKIDMFKTYNQNALKELEKFLSDFGGDQAA